MKSIRIQVGHPFIRMLQIHTSIWVIRSTCARTVSVLGSPQEWLKKIGSWFASAVGLLDNWRKNNSLGGMSLVQKKSLQCWELSTNQLPESDLPLLDRLFCLQKLPAPGPHIGKRWYTMLRQHSSGNRQATGVVVFSPGCFSAKKHLDILQELLDFRIKTRGLKLGCLKDGTFCRATHFFPGELGLTWNCSV